MATLVARVRDRISAESDDFFTDSVLATYVNVAQREIASFGASTERKSQETLRLLDGLRASQDDLPSGFNSVGSYYQGTVTIPTLLDFLYLVYNDTVPLKELKWPDLRLLHNGNLEPTSSEGYFLVTDSSGRVFELYLHEDPDGTTDTLTTHYITHPTDISKSDSSLSDFPARIEDVAVAGGAYYATQQEMKEGSVEVETLKQNYNQVLKQNLY